MHYGNRYANIVSFALKRGRVRAGDISAEFGIGLRDASTYLQRAMRRGHLRRPERGVYAPPSAPAVTSHDHAAACAVYAVERIREIRMKAQASQPNNEGNPA